MHANKIHKGKSVFNRIETSIPSNPTQAKNPYSKHIIISRTVTFQSCEDVLSPSKLYDLRILNNYFF